MSRKILLADDSVTIQKVIELTFMDEEYDVVSVSHGDAALERLDQVQPDIVIADIHMPGASGYEVCRKVKESHPEIPVLLLVGTFEPFEEAEADASGADSYLKKPFDSQELMRLVESLLPGAAAAGDGESSAEETEASAGGDLAGDNDTGDSTAADDTWTGTRSQAGFGSGEWGDSPADALEIETGEEPEVSAELEAGPFGEGSAEAAEAAESADEDLEDESWQSLEIPPADDEVAVDLSDSAVAWDSAEDGESDPTTEVEVVFAAEAEAAESAEVEAEDAAIPSYEAAEAPAAEAPATAEDVAASAEVASAEVVPPGPAVASSALSDDDVERIARRVVELLSKKAVQDIAWEVIPDLAEIVIRDRLNELESQLESQKPS